MSAPEYSLGVTRFDTFWAPRWVHHGVKVATGIIVLSVLVLAGVHALGWIVALSLGWYLTTKWGHLTPAQLVHDERMDVICDLALHFAWLPGWVLDNGAHPLAAVLLAVAIVIAYVSTYPWATP